MPLRSRSPLPDGASRLSSLLLSRPIGPTAGGGWTPVQDSFEDPFWPEPDLAESLPDRLPADRLPADRLAADHFAPGPGVDGSGVDGPVAVVERPRSGMGSAFSMAADAAVAAPTPAPKAPVEAGAPQVTTVWSGLRGGRFDPGRHGVLALVAVGVVAAALAGSLLLRGRPSEHPVAVPPVVPGTASSFAGGAEVVVSVAGKVRRNGLVHLPAGSRVDDAVRAAGGALPGVDIGLLNLARKLIDGEQVLVGVAAPAALPGAATGASASGLLDLNAAAASDLDALPGIGAVLAQRIVDWRTEHGRFASVDQLREVSGIGESKYASLKAKVRV